MINVYEIKERLAELKKIHGALLVTNNGDTDKAKLLGAAIKDIEDLLNDRDKWVWVGDSKPPKGSDILAYVVRGEETRVTAANYDYDEDGVDHWQDCIMNCEETNISHWMPVPSGPVTHI